MTRLTKEALDAIVDRFLAWPLPKDFSPDCGISFDGRKDDERNKNKSWPIGTNLFTAEQARAMFEYALAAPAAEPVIAPVPAPAEPRPPRQTIDLIVDMTQALESFLYPDLVEDKDAATVEANAVNERALKWINAHAMDAAPAAEPVAQQPPTFTQILHRMAEAELAAQQPEAPPATHFSDGTPKPLCAMGCGRPSHSGGCFRGEYPEEKAAREAQQPEAPPARNRQRTLSVTNHAGPPCRNCGQPINAHRVANFADGPMIGANFMVCPTATYQPAHALGDTTPDSAASPTGGEK